MPNPNHRKTIKQQNKRNGRDKLRPFFICQFCAGKSRKKHLPKFKQKATEGDSMAKYLNNNMQGVNTYRWMNEFDAVQFFT